MYKRYLLVLIILVFIGFMAQTMIATPTGANVTEGTTSSQGNYDPANHSAYAGNITELNMDGDSVTQTWQGYFGNVTGSIKLADGSGNVLYNWSQSPIEGEIYAANITGITWANITCFNFSSTTEENLSTLESAYNIGTSDNDGVNETFYLRNHPVFSTGTTSFSSGECFNSNVFDAGGGGSFNEVLLYENSLDIPVFAAIINDSTLGFNSKLHDFEMLVLEDGHDGDTSATVYYFYAEIG